MRYLLLLSLLLASPVFAQDMADQTDFDGVHAALDLYLQGHATGNSDFMREAFHEDAKLFWIVDGEVQQRTATEFAGFFSGEPAPDEADRERRIVSIEVTGDAAIGVIELDYPTVKFVDYMSLLRVGDRWLIVNKSFQR
ncbi:MAG: nuclear transport factor 2 family protein, partial [Bacteroidota bacterium]